MEKFLILFFLMTVISLLRGSLAGPLEPNFCALKIDGGFCRGSLRYWGYDSGEKQCIPFKYGGCGGNRNRFMTKESCESKCLEKICKIERNEGPCPGNIVWGYDPAQKKCVKYHYSKCTGLGNRFHTEKSCQKSCSKN